MFTEEIANAAKLHAQEQFPNESVGYVIDGVYVPQVNIAENPEEHFKVDEAVFPTEGLEAIIHSHPGDEHVCPSEADMVSQINTAVPWAIVPVTKEWVGELLWFGDQVPRAPLIGRKFVPGVQDCFALIRDDRYEKSGIWIPDFPRDDLWWKDENGTELLTPENFMAAGYTEISYSELEPGDVILANILCQRVNHSGIYIGQGLVLHHLYGRMSKREPLGPWLKFCRYYLRYTG